MNTAKRVMMALVVMVMAVMVIPNTSAEAAAVAKLNKKKAKIVINDAADKKKKLTKYTLKLTGMSKNVAKKAKWSSSNKKIATVNRKGVVTGKKCGRATITCKVNGQKYTCIIGVIDAKNGKTLEKSISKDAYLSYATCLRTSDTGTPVAHIIKVRGYHYFSYFNEYRYLKNKYGIKEGRLKSKNIWDKCNQDPEYKKAQAEAKAKENAKAAEVKAKEDAEAARNIAEAKARDEAIAKEIAEQNAKREAAIKAFEETVEKAKAEGKIVLVTLDGYYIASYEELEALEKEMGLYWRRMDGYAISPDVPGNMSVYDIAIAQL